MNPFFISLNYTLFQCVEESIVIIEFYGSESLCFLASVIKPKVHMLEYEEWN